MKTKFKFVLFLGLLIAQFLGYSQSVIVDHRAVDRYDDIPDEYIAKVKKMLLNIAGESHSRGYRYGLLLLETQNPKFAVNLKMDNEPEASTDQYLRVSGTVRFPNANWHNFVGEEDVWTTPWAINNFVSTIKYMDETAGNPISAMGIGWCYDMYNNGFAGTADPVYGCRWQGRSAYYISTDGSGNPQFSDDNGWLQWGIDREDSIDLGGPRVTLNMYIRAIEAARQASPNTVVFFTTTPVDWKNSDQSSGNEGIYQAFVKHEYIRNYVKDHSGTYLFDYADILCWSEAGEQRTETWEGHTYQKIRTEYVSPEYDGGSGGCHINEAACLRLGKAMWWMLAHIAGWKDETIDAVNQPKAINNDYKVFPNPTKDRITISSELTNPIDVELLDSSGKIILKKHFDNLPEELNLVNLNLSNSVYLLKIDNGENTSIVKVVLM